jgi:hypothetical protein
MALSGFFYPRITYNSGASTINFTTAAQNILARDGGGDASDPAEEARQYQQLRERLARDEGWLTQVLREFARLNQARDLRLLPVAPGTVNF